MSGRIQQFVSFLRHEAIRIRYSNSYIQQLHKSLTICLSSLDLSVSEYRTYNICNFATTYMMDRLPKKFAQPIHPSTATAQPPVQFAVNANTCLPNPNPNPKPGFDLSQTRKPGFTKGTRVWKL